MRPIDGAKSTLMIRWRSSDPKDVFRIAELMDDQFPWQLLTREKTRDGRTVAYLHESLAYKRAIRKEVADILLKNKAVRFCPFNVRRNPDRAKKLAGVR